MNIYQYNDLKIEVFNDPSFEAGNVDNVNSYLHHYLGDDSEDFVPASKHGVKVYKQEQVITSCILTACSGATGIHKTASLLSNDQLLICCCDMVFCLTLPSLNLNWSVKCDTATCFQIYPLEDDYLIHGELEITRIDNAGHIKWQFSGRDIFVTVDGNNSFKLHDDHIQLIDFNGDNYRLDYDGNLLS